MPKDFLSSGVKSALAENLRKRTLSGFNFFNVISVNNCVITLFSFKSNRRKFLLVVKQFYINCFTCRKKTILLANYFTLEKKAE